MKTKHPLRSIITCPSTHCLIELDLSAAESWVVAHLANDSNMIYQLKQGDLHSYSAQNIYLEPRIDKSDTWKTQRYIGKKMNHASSYRATPPKIAEFINKEGGVTVSIAQVKVWHTRWKQAFNMQYWWNSIDEQLYRDRTLITPYGYKRTFYGILSSDDTKKAATAFVPQSTVSYHMDGCIHPELGISGGILEIHNQITSKNDDIKLLQTAHDSVLIECPTDISLEIGEKCAALLTRPLVVNGQEFTIPVDCERFPRRWKEDGESLKDGRWVGKKAA